MNVVNIGRQTRWTRRADQSARAGLSYQEAIAGDPVAAPANLRQAFPLILDEPIGRDRYVSPAFHDREVRGLWSRVWQFACREEEVAEAGDIVVYEIAKSSFIIVRGDDDTLRAFRNTCLHRGTKLCPADTSIAQLRCPFHGFTWSLEGSLIDVPSRWDFPALNDEDARLREVKLETWGGFVFINPDPDAESLMSYLEVIPQHFTGFLDYSRKYVAARFRKVLPCNWKLGIEAFIESYHSLETHPQVIPFSSDENAQYDVLGRHVSRFLIANALPSSQISEQLTEQQIVDALFAVMGATEIPAVPAGMTARAFMAGLTRRGESAKSGRDYAACSDAEVLDPNQYSIFPNIVLFRSLSFPVVYRFRPNGADPHSCIFDLYFMQDLPISGARPAPAEVKEIGEGSFEDAMRSYSPFLGTVYDQDTQNVGMQQLGLSGSPDEPLFMAREMETRIRHLEQVLDGYLARYAPIAAGAANEVI